MSKRNEQEWLLYVQKVRDDYDTKIKTLENELREVKAKLFSWATTYVADAVETHHECLVGNCCKETEGFKGTEYEGVDVCEDGCVWYKPKNKRAEGKD